MQPASQHARLVLQGWGLGSPPRGAVSSILRRLDMFSIWIGLLGSYWTIPFLGPFSGGSQVTFVLSSLVFRRQGVY